MSKVKTGKRVQGSLGDYFLLSFYCPGCEREHDISIGENPGPEWYWDGDRENPTIKPSIMVNRGGANPIFPQCHSFITSGQIRFLNDCTHKLAGQTVTLPAIEAVDNGKDS